MRNKEESEAVKKIREIRWRARTDLLFLCNEILGYPDVSKEVHGVVLDRLQKFQLPTPEEYEMHDVWDGKKWLYRPVIRHQDLPGKRRFLYLDSRSFLKSTINTIAHTVQYIINYPNIAIMISVANTERAKILLSEIMDHFTKNQIFRRIFPELCPPPGKEENFGRQDGFTTPGRDFTYELQQVRKEPTVHLGTIEKAVASLHFDVIKFSDVVDEENSQTREQCEKIVKSFSAKLPAVVDYRSWVYVEGTRYHNDDLYGRLMAADMEREAKGIKPQYNVFMRGCFARVNPTYDLSDLDKPFKLTPEGNFISVFPQRMPVEALLAIKDDPIGGITFNEQYLNDPTPTEASSLPTDNKGVLPSYMRPDKFALLKIAYFEYAVDFAETLNQRSDYSAHSIIAWDFSNRPYICEIRHGKFKEEENILHMVQLYQKYRPQRIYIEESSYNRGLFTSIDRFFKIKNLYPVWEWMPRRGVKKPNRIGGSLSPWWKSRTLRFVYSEEQNPTYQQITTESMLALKRESRSFPKGSHDDILDTLSDLVSQKTYFARLGPRDSDDPQVGETAMEKIIHGGREPMEVYQNIFGGTVLPAFARDINEYGY